MSRRQIIALSLCGLGALAALVLAVIVWNRPDPDPLVVVKRESAPVSKPAGTSDWSAVYKRAAPSVVTVRALFSDDVTTGSGAIIDAEGWIITNAHVISAAPEGKSTPRTTSSRIYVDLADGRHLIATLAGWDPWSDLALLRVSATGLRALPIGDSAAVRSGDPVAAIGAPFGLAGSLSVGVVSATGRSIRSLSRRFSINDVIQTDAAINRGNSGGPLLDRGGAMIGINAQIQTEDDANDGVGYAIPSSLVMDLLPRLRVAGRLEHGYAGLTTQTLTAQLAERLGLSISRGALVQQSVAGGPAAKAGITSATGAIDFYGQEIASGGAVIVSLDGSPIVSADQLAGKVFAARPGQVMRVALVEPDGGRRSVSIKLVARPE